MKLQIRKLPPSADIRPDRPGLKGFPWNSYWEVREGPHVLAVVSTCNEYDKSINVKSGHLTRGQQDAVARALKVSLPNWVTP